MSMGYDETCIHVDALMTLVLCSRNNILLPIEIFVSWGGHKTVQNAPSRKTVDKRLPRPLCQKY